MESLLPSEETIGKQSRVLAAHWRSWRERGIDVTCLRASPATHTLHFLLRREHTGTQLIKFVQYDIMDPKWNRKMN